MKLVAKDDDPNKPKPSIQILQIFAANLWLRLYVGKMTNGFDSLKEVDYEGYGAIPVPRTFKYWKMIVTDSFANVYNKKAIQFPEVKKIKGLTKNKIKITFMALTDRNGKLLSNYLVEIHPPLIIKKGYDPKIDPGGFLIEESF